MNNYYLNDEIPKQNSPINLVHFTVRYKFKIEGLFSDFTIIKILI